MQRQLLCKAVNTLARKAVFCPYCQAINGTVKKAGALKIIHDKFRAKKVAEEMEKWKKTFAPAVEAQKELGMYLSKAVHEDLNPLKVLDLFKRISDEVCVLYNFVCYTESLLRIANCWVSDQNSDVPKNLFGNISLCPLFVFVHPLLRMVPQTKTI